MASTTAISSPRLGAYETKRNVCPTASNKASIAAIRRKIAELTAPLLRERLYRAHFNGTEAGARDFGSYLHRLVNAACFHQIVTAELLFGLREWPVGVGRFTVAHPHRLGSLGRLQGIASLDGLGKLLAKCLIFTHLRLVIPVREALLISVDQQQILHVVFLLTGSTN